MGKPVYVLLLSAFFGAYLYMLDRMYRISKTWLKWNFLFPALSFIFLCKYWDETKGPFVFMLLFLIALGTVGMITGQPYGENALKFIGYVFFWPIALTHYAWPYLEPTLTPWLNELKYRFHLLLENKS